MNPLIKCLLAMALLTAFIPAFADPPCGPPPPGLTNWWAGEGNAEDSRGSANGTISGGVSFVPGIIGQAFRFDGTSGLIDLGSNVGNFGTSDFSIVYWVRTTTSAVQAVMGKREPCCCENFVDIRMWSGLLGLEMLESHGGSYSLLGGPDYDHMRVNDGQWHLVAEIREGTTLSIVVDSRLDTATVTQDVINISSAIPFVVGWCACVGVDNTVPLSGDLDEIQFYDHALSSQEVEDIFLAGSGYPFVQYRLDKIDLRFGKEEGPYDGYTVAGRFTVDPDSCPMDLLSDKVTIAVGPTTLPIPAGSFTRDKALYSCRMDIGGVPVSAVFEDLGGGSFAFVIDARSVDLSGTTNVVPVALWVGSDWGKTSSHLAGSLSLDGGIAVPGRLAPATPVPMPRGR